MVRRKTREAGSSDRQADRRTDRQTVRDEER